MFVYKIKQGELRNEATGEVHSGLYSGDPAHKNDPLATNMKAQGPIPVGVYWIGEPRDTDKHGPYFIPLIPVPGSEMFGRSAFGFHGDNIAHPGTASEGCVIGPRLLREQVGQHIGGLFVVLSGN
jgi:hypothetical protein